MLKKFILSISIFIVLIYVLFLTVPFLLTSVINSYNGEIVKLVKENVGLNLNLGKLRLMTTPKLSVGLEAENIGVSLPTGESVFKAENFSGKVSLIPILFKKIELDSVSAQNFDLTLKIKKDGKFLIEDYLVQNDENSAQQVQNEAFELPFGIKLSNKLPDIKIKNYNISFVDMPTSKTYSVYGNKFFITDFILDKNIKLDADGKIKLDNREQFSYDVKIVNKIMPELSLHDMIFNPSNADVNENETVSFDFIEVFKKIYQNQLRASLTADIKTSGTADNIDVNGSLNISNLSLAVDGKLLPESSVDFYSKGKNTKFGAKLFTAPKELTELSGNFTSGKHKNFDLTCRSNAQFNSIINIIDSIAKTFNIKDFDTLSAKGGIDADFSIKSDMKNVTSSGYIKIPDASVNYKLYNTSVEKIFANIQLANNFVEIKDAGFTIMKQPLKIRGTLSHNADIDMSLIADKLQLKGLLVSVGQAALVKDYNIKDNALLSLNVEAKGKLDKFDPKISVIIDNINILKKGDYIKFNAKIVNDHLEILQAGIFYNNSVLVQLKGAISDIYNSQKLKLNASTPKSISMEVPYFAKSNMNLNFNVDVSGKSSAPELKGPVSIPTLNIPDMLLTMNDLSMDLNGPIAKGKGTLKKIVSGGIIAQNLSSDFVLDNNMLYLKGILGDAFGGKIKGDVSYNITNGKIGVILDGSSMDAQSAIYGAAGIKNALSGTLNFSANVTTSGADDVEMMKNLKGKAAFDIKDGKLGNIGRFETFVLAGNVVSNPILKTAVNTFSSLATVQKTAEFSTIDGNLNFNNGWADLVPVKMSGQTMAYYVTGKYNLINASANVIILGRISSEVVSLLGPVGELSVSKLTSYIPVFGTATGNIINMLTSNPDKEKIENIPALSSGSSDYKDFKVEFNGGVESSSSVKSFKWLTKCDTSELQQLNIKDEIEHAKNTVNEIKKQNIESINKAVNEQKQQIQNVKNQINDTKNQINDTKNELKNTAEELKNTADELKNLFKF